MSGGGELTAVRMLMPSGDATEPGQPGPPLRQTSDSGWDGSERRMCLSFLPRAQPCSICTNANSAVPALGLPEHQTACPAAANCQLATTEGNCVHGPCNQTYLRVI